MFQPYYIKSEYMKRILYSGALLVGILIGAGLLSNTSIGVGISSVCLILLAFLSMRLLSDLITKLTGFTFFLSLFGMFILFIISLCLSIFLGPLYFAFNLIQYFRASKV
ncbi:MAG: hypothetical protein COA43_09800 [Robiginitomaculum sp.]|nr:MAG: hypothetical protein COA43_09800 [Robiginitomaculum sp.]